MFVFYQAHYAEPIFVITLNAHNAHDDLSLFLLVKNYKAPVILWFYPP